MIDDTLGSQNCALCLVAKAPGPELYIRIDSPEVRTRKSVTNGFARQ
jgi:hypothetical protein